MNRFSPLFAVLTAVLLLCCATNSSATIHFVTIGNNFFAPLKTTVTPGDTVRWMWMGGIPHNTTSEAGSAKAWASPTSSSTGFMFEVQFLAEDGPGPFPYMCTIHSGTMKDTIFVAPSESCCSERVGDANGSGSDTPTIGDISVMIDAKFVSGDPELITCYGEADINQSGGPDPGYDDITIGDISYLIDYLFVTGPSIGLPDCL